MTKKYGALRPLLRMLRWLAVGLVSLDLVLLGLRLWPGLLSPPQTLGGRLTSALVSMLLLVLVLLLTRRLERLLDAAEDDARRQRQVFDALQAGVVLFDAGGRIEFTNAYFAEQYRALGPHAQPGARYEDLLRAALAAGFVPEAAADEEAWVARRLATFGRASPGLMRRLPDGRTLRITELTLPDGRVLAHLVDVSERVAKEQALEEARRDAEQARQRLAGAIEALPATFELYDADDRLVLWNHALAEAYPHMAPHLDRRLTFEELTRLNLAAGGQPDHQGRADDWVAERLAQRRAGAAASDLMNNGRGRWLRMYEKRLRDGSIVAIRVDVTEAVQQRAELEAARRDAERSRQRLEDAIEALPAGFELYDAEGRLVMVNGTNLAMYPQLADLVDRRPTFEEVVRTNAARGGLPELSTPELLDAWIARRQRQRLAPAEPHLHPVAGGRWVRTYERRMRDGGLVAIRLDVSDAVRREAELKALNERLQELNAELARLSRTDELTGLANRRAFDERLSEEVARASRHGMPLALLLVDVDHFKRYNDRYGHAAGDHCLRQVATVLRSGAGRPTDLVARVGGEEFALLLPHEAGRGALALAHRLLQALDRTAVVHEDSPVAAFVTASVGVADLWSCGARDAATLFAAADAALYAAKEQGRHRAVVHGAE